MSAIAEHFLAPRRSIRSRLWPRLPNLDAPPAPVVADEDLARLHPQVRRDLGLPEPEPDLATLLNRLHQR